MAVLSTKGEGTIQVYFRAHLYGREDRSGYGRTSGSRCARAETVLLPQAHVDACGSD